MAMVDNFCTRCGNPLVYGTGHRIDCLHFHLEKEMDLKAFSMDQPPPVKNELPAIWDLVVLDMQERDNVGKQRYGTRLQPNNGRDALKDAYAEALDLVVYLRQAIWEKDGK